MKTLKIKHPKMDVQVMQPLSLSGADGPVYRISEDKVAKFGWANGNWESLVYAVSPVGEVVQKEYEICKALYEKGVSVPQPYGVFRLKQPADEAWSLGIFPTRFPAFIMEYLDGGVPNSKYLKPEAIGKVEELVKIERDKVRDLGFITSDAMGWENTIWVPSKEKIFLIDFSRWELPKTK